MPPPACDCCPKFVEVCVSRSKLNRLLPIGLLMLAAGLWLHIGMRGDYAQSVSGFLLGISLVFIGCGFWSQKSGALA